MTFLAQSADGPWTLSPGFIVSLGIVAILAIVGFIIWKLSQP